MALEADDQRIPGLDDGLTERDPTPPEYEHFKQWFYTVHPKGDCMVFQTEYRAFQAGYHTREMRDRERAG